MEFVSTVLHCFGKLRWEVALYDSGTMVLRCTALKKCTPVVILRCAICRETRLPHACIHFLVLAAGFQRSCTLFFYSWFVLTVAAVSTPACCWLFPSINKLLPCLLEAEWWVCMARLTSACMQHSLTYIAFGSTMLLFVGYSQHVCTTGEKHFPDVCMLAATTPAAA